MGPDVLAGKQGDGAGGSSQPHKQMVGMAGPLTPHPAPGQIDSPTLMHNTAPSPLTSMSGFAAMSPMPTSKVAGASCPSLVSMT